MDKLEQLTKLTTLQQSTTKPKFKKIKLKKKHEDNAILSLNFKSTPPLKVNLFEKGLTPTHKEFPMTVEQLEEQRR